MVQYFFISYSSRVLHLFMEPEDVLALASFVDYSWIDKGRALKLYLFNTLVVITKVRFVYSPSNSNSYIIIRCKTYLV